MRDLPRYLTAHPLPRVHHASSGCPPKGINSTPTMKHAIGAVGENRVGCASEPTGPRGSQVQGSSRFPQDISEVPVRVPGQDEHQIAEAVQVVRGKHVHT